MAIKINDLDRELMKSINKSKARGKQIYTMNAIQSNSFARLVSSGLVEDINGFAYLTQKGIKKVSKT